MGKVWDASGPSLSELLKQRSGLPPSPSAASPSARPAQAPVEPNIEPVALDELPALWNRMLDLLAARGAYLLAAVKCGRLASIEDDSAILRFDRKNDTFVKMLNGKKDLLRDLMTQAAGKPLGVRFEVEDVEPAAPTASSGASRGGTSGGTGGGVGGGGGDTAVMEAPARVEQQQPATQPAARRPEPARRAEPPPPPPMPAAPVANLIKVTPDVVEDLRNREPLIKGLMDELGAQIVKVEAPESVNA